MNKRYKKSNELFKRAKKVIPLGSQTFSKSYLTFPFEQTPLFLTHGRGAYLWDVDGHKYIDFIIDDNVKKHNTYSPGFHINVHDKSFLETYNIKYLIILAWQHQETIVKKHNNFIKKGGKVLIPLPEFKVIE